MPASNMLANHQVRQGTAFALGHPGHGDWEAVDEKG
jgi:hypothetical protein